MTRIAILAFCAAGRLFAQESAVAVSNPFTSDADVARGERTFLSQCASCHGRDGRGGAQGPDLSTGSFRRASSDEGLFQIVNKGIPGTTMPGIALNAGQVWQVVAYVRSLGMRRKNLAVAGNAARGEQLYRAHGCGNCHASGAPDLAGVGDRRSVEELRQSILDPQADVPSAYWRIRATTRDGRVVTGARLNEDTFTLQLRDDRGALRSLVRSDLTRVEYDRRSPMPSFRGKLGAAELDDLLAYLVSRSAP